MTKFKLYTGAFLFALLGTCVALLGWRAWTDYRDFQAMRAFLAPIMMQQAQLS